MNDNIVKSAAKNLASKVRQMRNAQTDYFKAPPGSPEKSRALTTAKMLETQVDKLIANFETTIDKL
jgi:hypothetical protein